MANGTRRSIAGWCLYDWAMSAFNTVVGTFVFSVYFARGVVGDEVAGSAQWGFAMGAAGFAVALLAPVLGAIADRSGARKPWLAAFTLAAVAATAALWWVQPDPAFIVLALTLAIGATIAFELAQVVYNAMLDTVAPPGKLGRVSGWGWGLGYFGGLSCLAFALFGFIGMGDAPGFLGIDGEEGEAVRATMVMVACWYFLFALPLFLFARDRPATRDTPPGTAVREGLGTLWRTLKRLPSQGNLLRFLIASALYRDGLATLFAVGGLYAAGTFGMGFDQLILFAIGLNVTSGLGAIGFAWMDDKAGSKPTVVLALVGLIATGLPILLIESAGSFIALALLLGIFVGPAQAASRSLMARLSPPGLQTEYFGLYALTGKSIAFLGPVAFGALTAATGSQRWGMATIIAFLAAGLALLLTVRDQPAATPR